MKIGCATRPLLPLNFLLHIFSLSWWSLLYAGLVVHLEQGTESFCHPRFPSLVPSLCSDSNFSKVCYMYLELVTHITGWFSRLGNDAGNYITF